MIIRGGDMRVYIAAHYSRKAEMIQMAQVLQEHGVDNTATWLTEPHAATTTMRSMPYSALYNYALRDLEDISRADALVLFSFDSLLPACRGGHNVEMPAAISGSSSSTRQYPDGFRPRRASCPSAFVRAFGGRGLAWDNWLVAGS